MDRSKVTHNLCDVIKNIDPFNQLIHDPMTHPARITNIDVQLSTVRVLYSFIQQPNMPTGRASRRTRSIHFAQRAARLFGSSRLLYEPLATSIMQAEVRRPPRVDAMSSRNVIRYIAICRRKTNGSLSPKMRCHLDS